MILCYFPVQQADHAPDCWQPRFAKNGVNAPIKVNAPGRLDIFFNRRTPRVRCKRPGALFFALFRVEGPVGRAHDTRRCAKRICCRSGKGRFVACSGRNSTGIFLNLHIYSSIQALKKNFCLFFFFFWKHPWGPLLPYSIFFLKNAPGALFRNCFMERPRGRLLR